MTAEELKVRHPIAVVLATYNGERYLKAQLDSLWGQTRQDFELLVRDDGSDDGTLEVLHQTVSMRPERVRILNDGAGRLGPKSSFATLLRHTEARWIAFCDQDDYWLPDKLERQVAELQRLEAAYGESTPILCCSDAVVTDSDLRVLAPSYFARHNISVVDGRDLALPRLLFRNYAIGATTMINAALASRCRAMPAEAIMHDWWCALVACVFGRSVALPQALLHYRQHGANAVGSRRRAFPRSTDEFREYLEWARASSVRCVKQADALHRTAMLVSSARSASAILEYYASFESQSHLKRLLTLIRTRSFKPGLALNSLHLYACMTARL